MRVTDLFGSEDRRADTTRIIAKVLKMNTINDRYEIKTVSV